MDDGATAAAPGRAERPDVTLSVSYGDLVDVIAGRADPRRLMLRGRLRPRGSLRARARLPRLFDA